MTTQGDPANTPPKDPALTPPEGLGKSKTGLACLAIVVVLVVALIAIPIIVSRMG